jgi:glycosyltransferase involved in cell wall biosynthesis
VPIGLSEVERLRLSEVVLLSTESGSGKGGIATSVSNCLEILRCNGIAVRMVVTHKPGVGALKALWVFIKAVLAVLLVRNRAVFFLHVGPRGSLIRKLILALIIKLRRGALITQYHSPIFYDYIKRGGVWYFFLKALSKLSNRNLALNRYWKRIFEKGLTERFLILPNPVVIGNGVEFKRANKSLGGEINLISVARLVKEKNVQEVINLVASSEGLRLTIIGGGPYEKELRRLVTQKKVGERVSFLGWQDSESVRAYLSRADLFVLPSKYDSFGMVYLEALREGIPVIAPTLTPVKSTLAGLYGVFYADVAENIISLVPPALACSSELIFESLSSKYGERKYFNSLSEVIDSL